MNKDTFKYIWGNYQQTERGKDAIKDFSLLNDNPEEISITFRYNEWMRLFYDNRKTTEMIKMVLDDYWEYAIGNKEVPTTTEEAKQVYEEVITNGLALDGNVAVEKEDYQFALSINAWISWLLYQLAPEFFFPNLMEYQARNLYRIADAFDIELPSIPKKADYKARCMYYWELCEAFYKFRKDNELSPQELCAFLYDYAPNFIPNDNSDMPTPSQVWMIGGRVNEADHIDNGFVFWQGNQETRKGDILIHYETSPVSAITHIWQAATDGMIDPFFHYYGCTYITNRIDIPHITLDEIKSDRYFSTHPLVRKNFQGANGWPLSASDYDHILRILEWKGMDVSCLPKLNAATINVRDDIKVEKDVENLLLEPLLKEMGFHDYKRQLPVQAGRGHRIFPDYALHYSDKHDEECAKVLIEAKYKMRNPQEVEDAFMQARSYARLLGASVIVLCDKECLLVYERGMNFDRHRYSKFYWGEMSNPDKFRILKKKLE